MSNNDLEAMKGLILIRDKLIRDYPMMPDSINKQIQVLNEEIKILISK